MAFRGYEEFTAGLNERNVRFRNVGAHGGAERWPAEPFLIEDLGYAKYKSV